MTDPRIVGLDLSLTATGMALADGSFTLVKSKPHPAGRMPRLAEIRSEVVGRLELMTDYAVNLVVIEGYSMASGQGAHQLGELGCAIRLWLHDHAVPFVEVAPTRLKKYGTGKGNASKDQMLAAAVRQWPEISDNNIADAAWLRDMAVAHYTARPLSKEKAALLAQVDWPVLSPSPGPVRPWDLAASAA